MTPMVTETAAGAVVLVRAKPGARETSVAVADGRVRVSVTARAERGKANDAVLKALGRALGLAPSSLEIVAGAGARDKRVLCKGVDAASLRARIEQGLAQL